MNLTHWANGAWANGTWVPTSWGTSTPPVPPRIGNPVAEVEIGDGYIRQGRLIRWIQRPKELEPERAEVAAVKKVAKRLKVTRAEAEQIVSVAQRELATEANFLHAADMATTGMPGGEYAPEEIADMRLYWAEVVRRAQEIEDDDEVMLLL